MRSDDGFGKCNMLQSLLREGFKQKKTMEFSKPGLTPASQATFGRSYGKKQNKRKRLKMIYVS